VAAIQCCVTFAIERLCQFRDIRLNESGYGFIVNPNLDSVNNCILLMNPDMDSVNRA